MRNLYFFLSLCLCCCLQCDSSSSSFLSLSLSVLAIFPGFPYSFTSFLSLYLLMSDCISFSLSMLSFYFPICLSLQVILQSHSCFLVQKAIFLSYTFISPTLFSSVILLLRHILVSFFYFFLIFHSFSLLSFFFSRPTLTLSPTLSLPFHLRRNGNEMANWWFQLFWWPDNQAAAKLKSPKCLTRKSLKERKKKLLQLWKKNQQWNKRMVYFL